jgi:hypothetical protein
MVPIMPIDGNEEAAIGVSIRRHPFLFPQCLPKGISLSLGRFSTHGWLFGQSPGPIDNA